MILAADLGEGMGSAHFQELVEEMTGPEEFLESLKGPGYRQLDQWMLQDHCNVLIHAGDVLVYTNHLSGDWLSKALVCKIHSLDEGLKMAFESHGPMASVAVMPQGPYVIARVSGTANV